MAAPAPAAAPALPADARWEEVVAHIDAMPGVPSWKQIEAEVDAVTKEEIDATIEEYGPARAIPYVRGMEVHVGPMWRGHLARLYLPVYYALQTTVVVNGMLRFGPRVWFIRNYVPGGVAAREQDITDEWIGLRANHTAYTLQRMSIADAQALLAAFNRRVAEGVVHPRDHSIAVRLRADLEAFIMRPRTDLAQSRLIDHLTMRDRDAAQHLAQWIAPETITPRRPLAVHAPVAPPMTRQQYLASILAVMNAPGQDPAATLARARAMLETLMGSIAAPSSQ